MKVPCYRCGGVGTMLKHDPEFFEMTSIVTCTICGGSGELEVEVEDPPPPPPEPSIDPTFIA